MSPTSRVLILAPHPDDEALGCGGLIQHALAVGAAVRVLFVTDGDNNPWPQRLAERRFRITPTRRAAWGARRRDEAKASIRQLGLTEADVDFAGLPDQGLTEDLLTGDGRFSKLLREQVRQFQPNLVVGPSVNDTHPDHSAIAVMTRLLLPDVPLLEYLIHGQSGPSDDVALSAQQVQIKRAAIQCHRTQMALSHRRFLAYARPTECFLNPWDDAAIHPIQRIARDDNGWALTLRPHARFGHFGGRHVDLLGVADGRIITRRRVKLAKRAHVIDILSGEVVASGCMKAERLHLPAHALPAKVESVIAKRSLRFGFFDEAGWRMLPLPVVPGVVGESALVAV